MSPHWRSSEEIRPRHDNWKRFVACLEGCVALSFLTGVTHGDTMDWRLCPVNDKNIQVYFIFFSLRGAIWWLAFSPPRSCVHGAPYVMHQSSEPPAVITMISMDSITVNVQQNKPLWNKPKISGALSPSLLTLTHTSQGHMTRWHQVMFDTFTTFFYLLDCFLSHYMSAPFRHCFAHCSSKSQTRKYTPFILFIYVVILRLNLQARQHGNLLKTS